MNYYISAGTFVAYGRQRERFREGELMEKWAESYPNLFDADDVRIARSQAHLGYHFWEWLAAIVLYNCTGYLSLVEQYQFRNHRSKQRILRDLLPSEVGQFISSSRGTQCPDLLAYMPDYSDWFFCEVKGPRDRTSAAQAEYFRELAEISGKPIAILKFKLIRV
jgi:hypothetical protein